MHTDTQSVEQGIMAESNAATRPAPQPTNMAFPVEPITESGVALPPFPTIAVIVDVQFPNGNEVLNAGDQVTISWQSQSSDGSALVAHDIQLFTDRMFNRDIATNLPGTAQSFRWTVPNLQTTQAIVLVRATNANGLTGSDRSLNFFTIQAQEDTQAPTVMVMTPNGGESFTPNQTVSIQWQSSDNRGVMSHDVLFSTDGGASFEPIATNVLGTQQSFAWTVPNRPTTQGRVKVIARDAAGNEGMDSSNNSNLMISGTASGLAVTPTGVTLVVTATPTMSATTIPVPPGQRLQATRVGTRLDPSTGMLQTYIGVLTEGTSLSGLPASLLRTFVPGQDNPVLQIQREGANRYTDFRFVDFAGNANMFLACFSEKSQDENRQDLIAQVQILDPQTGVAVQFPDPQTGVFRQGVELISVLDGQGRVNPDFGGAGIGKIGTKDYLVVIPQNSFIAFVSRVGLTYVYIFGFRNGTVQMTPIGIPGGAGGATVQRSMLAFDTTATGEKRVIVFSKDLVFAFDLVTGTQRARLELTAGGADNDVLNPPGNMVGSTPQGRRYGQFRVVNVAGGAANELVVAGHSLPKARSDDISFQAMYTTYPPIRDGSSGFLQPIWGPPDAPGNAGSRYRFFPNATKKADERTPDLQRFAFLNSALLLGGTPPNGMEDLGDGVTAVIVSDALPGKIPGVSPTLDILRADTGASQINTPYPGAVALDVLKVPGQPSRIIVWGSLLAGQSYANGRLQVLRYDPVQRALIKMTRFNGGLFEFEQGHQPVLLTFPMLHRLREDIGVQGDPLAEVLATPLIGSSRTFLTFRTSQVGVVDAYDQNTLERVPSSAHLNLGPSGVLLGIVDDLLLTTPEPVLPGSAFVVLENATDGGTVIRFKRVTPDGRLIPGKLMGTSTPGAGVSLSASPASQSITAGQSTSYTITINRTNYMGTVSLAVSGLPIGISAGLSPNPASGTNSVLTITSSTAAPSGTSNLSVSASAPGATIIPVTVNLTVNAPKAKEKEKEFKEKEAFEKNRVKDQKDLFEGGGFGGLGFQSAGVVAPLESQTRSAATGEPLMHFIGQESRPDMAYSALTAESDLNRAYLAAMSARLHGLVANAKQVKDAKDGKDVEKCSEHSS